MGDSLSHLDDLLFMTDCFCIVQIKASCIGDKENRRFYLLFLRLIWDLQRVWLQQKMLYLVLMYFIVELAPKWPREKDSLLHFIVDFARAAWLREQISYCCTQTVMKFCKKGWIYSERWLWSISCNCSFLRTYSAYDRYWILQALLVSWSPRAKSRVCW